MKLREAKVKLLTDATAAGLETAVNTFLATAKEGDFIGVQYQATGTEYSALVLYTG
jgi:hypothetical protein